MNCWNSVALFLLGHIAPKVAVACLEAQGVAIQFSGRQRSLHANRGEQGE
jgi:hypothetical protein